MDPPEPGSPFALARYKGLRVNYLDAREPIFALVFAQHSERREFAFASGASRKLPTATPVGLTGTMPRTVEPVVNVTVPVGEGEARLEAMVAVRVTLVPGGTGVDAAMDEARVILVAAGVTTTLSGWPALLAKFKSPL